MAEKITTFEFKAHGPRSEFPWDKWLDGSIWRIPSSDFSSISSETFRTRARSAAAYRGRLLRSNIDGDAVVIQSVPR